MGTARWGIFTLCELIYSWLGGKQQSAHSYAVLFTEMCMLVAVKIVHIGLCICRCVCRFVSSQHRGEWQSCSVQISPSPGGSHGGEASTLQREKAAHQAQKAGPKLRLNPFMWDLFSCCEWQMHVWTPAVSKCLFTDCKSAASKHKYVKTAAHC